MLKQIIGVIQSVFLFFEYLTLFAVFLGSLTGVIITIGAFWNFWRYTSRLGIQDLYYLYGKQTKDDKQKSWALVLGGDSGMGLGYCRELARFGFNIYIVSGSNESQISETIVQLQKEYPKITFKSSSVNYSQMNTAGKYADLAFSIFKRHDIAIFVVAEQFDCFGTFEQLTNHEVEQLTHINVISVVYMTYFAIEYMQKRQERSALIGVSNILDIKPAPGFCLQAAGNVFISHMFNCLEQTYSQEVKNGKKFDVLSFRPNLVENKSIPVKPSLTIPSCLDAARGSLQDLGKHRMSNGYAYTSFQDYLSSALMTNMYPIMSQQMINESKFLRDRINKKK